MRFRPHLALAALLFAGATAVTPLHALAAPRSVVALQDSTQGPLPYVDFIRIGGRFPNGCFSFDRIELLPQPLILPSPRPRILVIVSDGSCFGNPACPD